MLCCVCVCVCVCVRVCVCACVCVCVDGWTNVIVHIYEYVACDDRASDGSQSTDIATQPALNNQARAYGRANAQNIQQHKLKEGISCHHASPPDRRRRRTEQAMKSSNWIWPERWIRVCPHPHVHKRTAIHQQHSWDGYRAICVTPCQAVCMPHMHMYLRHWNTNQTSTIIHT